ncbi:MAG: Septum site-determining protein DivIVA [Pelotomaculum sp. PtaU1.Bin035]|nr:MAG: Septum site-determining protein DivIVA [Pelotomaculum sp. PtaU1.Bin035]
MLTPLDIQKKEFRHTFRGYNVYDVDSFLDRVIQDYEKLYKENLDLTEKLAQANQNMTSYREIEEVLKNTMVMAQKNADELKRNTEKETALILDRARVEADQIAREAEQEAVALIRKAEQQVDGMVSEAEKKVQLILEEYHRIERQSQVFRMRFRALLEAQVRFLESEEEVPIEEEKIWEGPICEDNSGLSVPA